MINNCEIDILDFIIRCQRKNGQLNDGYCKDQRKQRFVAKDLLKLFTKDKEDGPHANRTLNFLKLSASKNKVIPKRITVSFQMEEKPSPLIMIDFTMI